MANILFRESTTADLPTSISAKGTPLSNLQLDGNFRSLNEELITKAPLANPIFTGTPTINSTSALGLPVGTTAQQPIGVTGYIRFNSSTATFEGYNGTSWSSIGGSTNVKGIAIAMSIIFG